MKGEEMQELSSPEMQAINGGMTLACGLWWTMWGTVAGVAIIGGGPVGWFGAGLALYGALSDESPC
jgi:hypothetical protein